MANILNSPGRYVQGAGELSKLGKYAEGYGKKAPISVMKSWNRSYVKTAVRSYP